MRKVNVRKFHNNMWEEIKDLPIIVTRWGKPSFFVDIVPTDMNPKRVTFKISPSESPAEEIEILEETL